MPWGASLTSGSSFDGESGNGNVHTAACRVLATCIKRVLQSLVSECVHLDAIFRAARAHSVKAHFVWAWFTGAQGEKHLFCTGFCFFSSGCLHHRHGFPASIDSTRIFHTGAHCDSNGCITYRRQLMRMAQKPSQRQQPSLPTHRPPHPDKPCLPPERLGMAFIVHQNNLARHPADQVPVVVLSLVVVPAAFGACCCAYGAVCAFDAVGSWDQHRHQPLDHGGGGLGMLPVYEGRAG